jgi:hypothetical protein
VTGIVNPSKMTLMDLGLAPSTSQSLTRMVASIGAVGRDSVTIEVSLGRSIVNERPQATEEIDALKTRRSEKAAGARVAGVELHDGSRS